MVITTRRDSGSGSVVLANADASTTTDGNRQQECPKVFYSLIDPSPSSLTTSRPLRPSKAMYAMEANQSVQLILLEQSLTTKPGCPNRHASFQLRYEKVIVIIRPFDCVESLRGSHCFHPLGPFSEPPQTFSTLKLPDVAPQPLDHNERTSPLSHHMYTRCHGSAHLSYYYIFLISITQTGFPFF